MASKKNIKSRIKNKGMTSPELILAIMMLSTFTAVSKVEKASAREILSSDSSTIMRKTAPFSGCPVASAAPSKFQRSQERHGPSYRSLACYSSL